MMSIERIVSDSLFLAGGTWKLTNNQEINPDEGDVEQALDHAYKVMYDEPVGNRMTIAGMIVERTETGCEVYVYAGTQEYKESND